MKKLIQISPFLIVTQSNKKSLLPKNSGLPHESKIDRVTPANFKYLEEQDPPESGVDFDPAISYFKKDFSATGLSYQIIDYTLEELEAQIPEVGSITKYTLFERLKAAGLWKPFKRELKLMDEDLRDAWDMTSDIKKDHPMIVTFATELQDKVGVTPEQMDELLTP